MQNINKNVKNVTPMKIAAIVCQSKNWPKKLVNRIPSETNTLFNPRSIGRNFACDISLA